MVPEQHRGNRVRILVFQHEDVEHPGVFREFWQAAGHTWEGVHLYASQPIPPLDDYDLLVVLGGPMDVWQAEDYPWLLPETEAIRTWVRDLGRPYLGICLGHQLLAAALGGTVGPMDGEELGLCRVTLTEAGRRDPLLSPSGQDFTVFHWHHAEVTGLPEGAEVLATNAASRVQAMRWGNAYGVQFHAEVAAASMTEWLTIPGFTEDVIARFGPGGDIRLDEDVGAALEGLNATARALNDGIMELAGIAPR